MKFRLEVTDELSEISIIFFSLGFTCNKVMAINEMLFSENILANLSGSNEICRISSRCISIACRATLIDSSHQEENLGSEYAISWKQIRETFRLLQLITSLQNKFFASIHHLNHTSRL